MWVQGTEKVPIHGSITLYHNFSEYATATVYLSLRKFGAGYEHRIEHQLEPQRRNLDVQQCPTEATSQARK